MIGYGNNPPNPLWPDKSRIIIQIVLNYEEGGENCLLHGDSSSEAYLSEIVGTEPWQGKRNMNIESMYEYGSRAGFWRLWRLFCSYDIPITVFAVATALQRNPDAAQAMKDAQWEIASHGLKWIDYKDFIREEELNHLKEAIRIHTEVTGARPFGWYLGRCTEHTRDLIVEEGGFLYDSDSYSDDLPYWIKTKNDNSIDNYHLVIPYTLDANDLKFCMPQGFNSGDQFFCYLRDTFDYLYSESKDTNSSVGNTSAKLMNIGLHCRISGRPGRTASIKRFLDYVKKFPDVKFMRRVDIAKHWHQNHYPVSSTS